MSGRSGSRPGVAATVLALALVTWSAASARADARVGELTVRDGDVPRRLLGYGLVVGLDGSGDRSFGTSGATTPTVRSVINLLRRFGIEVPPDRLRLRDVAAVAVTAEVSPYLHTGGRFDVQVSALGDAQSLAGGVLWMTPLVTGPDDPPVGSAQGALSVAASDAYRPGTLGRANTGRVPDGGVVEVDAPAAATPATRLHLRRPDPVMAVRIVNAIEQAFGPGTAKLVDPGAVSLDVGKSKLDSPERFLAAIDTLRVPVDPSSRIVIGSRDGTVVAGGGVRVSAAMVSHRGITLQIGGRGAGADSSGLVSVPSDASVQDVAVGLHAAGATAQDIVAIFEALQAAGALGAELVVR